MIDHNHLPETFSFIKRNWVWLSGLLMVSYYSIKWSITQAANNILSTHPTFDDMQGCQDKLVERFQADLDAHEEQETNRYDEQAKQFQHMYDAQHEATKMLHHSIERVEDKVTMIVSKLLDK